MGRISFLLIFFAALTGGALAQPPNKPNASTAAPITRLEPPPNQTPSAPPSSRQSPVMENPAAASFDHVVELTGQLDQRMLTTVYWCLGTPRRHCAASSSRNASVRWTSGAPLATVLDVLVRGVEALPHEPTHGPMPMPSTMRLYSANVAVQEKLRTEIRDAAKAAADAAVQPLRTRIDRMQTSVQKLTAQFVAIEVDDWVKQKVYVNAINTQIRYLVLIRDTDHPDGFFFNMGLDKLQQIFREAIEHEHPSQLDARDIAEITRFFDHTEKANPVVVGRLRDLC